MEYLVVNFEENRNLVIDDAPTVWHTNETVLIEAGDHIVALSSPPANFVPRQIELLIENTTVECPKIIKFVKV